MITRINVGTSVTELVGSTPLLALPSISAEVPGVDIFGKAEWYNPGGSVKDRPALWMIRDGEKTGALTPEKTILDATSGNTGIAYAWIGAALGYRVKLCMPKNASEERKKILRAYASQVMSPTSVCTSATSRGDGESPATALSTVHEPASGSLVPTSIG